MLSTGEIESSNLEWLPLKTFLSKTKDQVSPPSVLFTTPISLTEPYWMLKSEGSASKSCTQAPLESYVFTQVVPPSVVL